VEFEAERARGRLLPECTTDEEEETVGVSDDVSEISGPRDSSPGPNLPETQQTVCPLPSRQPPLMNARLASAPSLAAHIAVFFWPLCPHRFASRMHVRRRLASGQHARSSTLGLTPNGLPNGLLNGSHSINQCKPLALPYEM
jgi:hypothetical protein